MGGRLAWNQLHETIGLTHPFFHDLRSRGTGIVYHEVTPCSVMVCSFLYLGCWHRE